MRTAIVLATTLATAYGLRIVNTQTLDESTKPVGEHTRPSRPQHSMGHDEKKSDAPDSSDLFLAQ